MLAFTAAAQDQPPAVAAAPAAPPTPQVLENSGKPMRVTYRCTEDDLHWAGLSCNEDDPCPVFLELTTTNQVGNRIFTGGNIHTESVTLYSILLASEDNGKTWSEAHDRMRGAGLEHIQFFDSEIGWILGQELFPIPQNPFLLVTGDRGKTWRRHDVFNENSESRFGTIQQFGLAGKKDGSLIIDRGRGNTDDRYVLFESPDGGDTWSLKQESIKPLTLKNAVVPSADWRVRADGPSKSFHVEHRVAGRWSSLAAFSVDLDACKPGAGQQ